MFDSGTMRRRFHDLGAKRDEILSKSVPLRDERDAIYAEAEARVRDLNEQIKAVEAGLYEIDQERALISRALNGKTGAA